MALDIPPTIDDIDVDWLTEAVTGDGSPPPTITGHEHQQIGVGLGVLALLYRVALTYDRPDAGPATVVVKMASRHEATRQVVAGYRFYEREVGFYRDFADRVSLGTPHCHHAAFDQATGDFVIVMEDVGDLRAMSQLDGCSVEDARSALAQLARHHADWWLNEELLGFESLATTAEAPYPDFLAQASGQAWPRCDDIFGDRLRPEIRQLGADFAAIGPAMMREGAERPWTFNHGDFRLDNLFFDSDGSLVVLDWQIGFRTYGANDVGYFLSQSLQPDDRKANEVALLHGYHDHLVAGGVTDYSFDDLWGDYRRAILFCFNYPMTAAGQLDLSDDRSLALVTSMMDRSVAAITDLDALELSP